MIAIDHLVFDYPGARALHDVSAVVAAGSITALVGPNGAGKTTLMRCIAGLDLPLSGSVTLGGIDVAEEPRAARARLGFLQDQFGLYDRLSVARCLAWAAASRGIAWPEAHARVKPLAAMLDLTELLDRQAGKLSRGQRQRVAIGQAIAHAPSVLVLDEPASGLDPEARIGLAALLRSLRDQGMTILVSSHILAELAEYADALMILEKGRVLSSAPLAPPARRLVLRLAAPMDGVADWLATQAGVSDVAAEGESYTFAFDGDAPAQAALLAALVGTGLPVLAFAEDATTLQDAYLARLAAARA